MNLYAVAGLAVFLLGLVFALVFHRNKTSLWGGFLLWCFVAGLGFLLTLLAVRTGFMPLLWLVALLALFISFTLLFGVFGLIVFLLFNARLVWRREGHSVANALTLLLALGLIALLVLDFVVISFALPVWVYWVQWGLHVLLVCYFVHIAVFFTSVMLCNCARPAKKQNYIVVLGSGLVNGKVPPLLAGRINRAIAFYNAQKKLRTPPKLVMSGGQGEDEPVAEAVAMQRYALAKGVPPGDILTETQSKNTEENLRFSKIIMDADAQNSPYNCIYATSNYHLLRGGLYARRAGLAINGIGAKTALYYLPNALLREYMGYLAMHAKRHIIMAASLFLCSVLVAALLYSLEKFVG